MNKRRRFKAKRRRLVARYWLEIRAAHRRALARVTHKHLGGYHAGADGVLRFHRDAFALVWPSLETTATTQVIYGVGWFRDRLRPGVD